MTLVSLVCICVEVKVGVVFVEGVICQVHTTCRQIPWSGLLVPLGAESCNPLSMQMSYCMLGNDHFQVNFIFHAHVHIYPSKFDK